MRKPFSLTFFFLSLIFSITKYNLSVNITNPTYLLIKFLQHNSFFTRVIYNVMLMTSTHVELV